MKRRAQEIGIKEPQLYWIAEKSLQNPLPSGWIEAATEDGYLYFFNEETGESIWHHPALDHYKKQYATVLQQRQAQHIEYEAQNQKMKSNPIQEWQELEGTGSGKVNYRALRVMLVSLVISVCRLLPRPPGEQTHRLKL